MDDICFYEIIDTISQEKIRIAVARVFLLKRKHWIITPLYSSHEDSGYIPSYDYKQASWNYYYKYGDLIIECPDGSILRKLYLDKN